VKNQIVLVEERYPDYKNKGDDEVFVFEEYKYIFFCKIHALKIGKALFLFNKKSKDYKQRLVGGVKIR